MNATITSLAFRALLGRRRFWLFVAFPVCLSLIALLVRAMTGDPEAAWSTLMGLGVSILVPLMALIAASSVLGPEMDDGSIVYLLAKPVNRYSVALSKYVVAAASTLVMGVLPLLVIGLVVHPDEPSASFAAAAGAGLSAITYTAGFLALSATLRGAVIVGLLYTLIWEGTLGNVLSGIAWLSVHQWGQRLAYALHRPLDGPDITLWWALLASTLVVVGGVWFAGDRLRSYSLRGGDE